MTVASDRSEYVEKSHNAFTLLVTGDDAEALEIIEGLIESDPDEPASYYLLGLAAYLTGDFGRALDLFNSAHKIDPECREFADMLAVVYTVAGKLADGLYFAKLATALPSNPEIGHMVPANLSSYFDALDRVRLSTQYINAMMEYNQRHFTETIKRCEMELRVNEDHHPCMALIGKAHHALGDHDKAVGALQSAIRFAPDVAGYYFELGDALYHLGRFDEAVACHREALRRDLDSIDMASRAVAAAEYLDDGGVQRRAFRNVLKRRLAAQPKSEPLERGLPLPDDRIRIGYISNSLFGSEAGTFVSALLEFHNHNRYHIAVYQQSIATDPILTQMEVRSDSWRKIFDLGDEVMEIIVNGDQIDVLVDLCGYTKDNRAALVAAHPAPVQVSWLEEPMGIGAEGVDVVLGDAVTAESDRRQLAKGQELIVLPIGLLAVPPMVFMPAVNALPATGIEHVTFGARCDLKALNGRLTATWAEILHRVPRSRLLLGNVANLTDGTRARVVELFSHYGVAERIQFWDTEGEERPNPEFFHNIDIYLDSFPVSGRLNLCEALWMGVPVLSVKGSRRPGLMGASILNSAAQPDWVCRSPEHMVQQAAALAQDLDALAETRTTLRDLVTGSALFHPEVFVPTLEAALLEAHERKKPKKVRKTSAKKTAPRKPAAKKAAKKSAPAKKAAKKKAPAKMAGKKKAPAGKAKRAK